VLRSPRGHLLYGECLSRLDRRIEARKQLRIAHGMLDAMGLEAFADHARRRSSRLVRPGKHAVSVPATSRRKRPRSPSSRPTVSRTRRSAAGSPSARERSSGT